MRSCATATPYQGADTASSRAAAAVFHDKVTTLAAGLEHDEHRDAARLALRGFLDRIVILPGDGLLQVVGNFGKMLDATSGRNRDAASGAIAGCGGGI